jgi:hypothetical protein
LVAAVCWEGALSLARQRLSGRRPSCPGVCAGEETGVMTAGADARRFVLPLSNGSSSRGCAVESTS